MIQKFNDCRFTRVTLIKNFLCFSDERERVQKKTFTKWINSHLAKTDCPPVDDLFTDLQDGSKLLSLIEALTGKKYVSPIENIRNNRENIFIPYLQAVSNVP